MTWLAGGVAALAVMGAAVLTAATLSGSATGHQQRAGSAAPTASPARHATRTVPVTFLPGRWRTLVSAGWGSALGDWGREPRAERYPEAVPTAVLVDGRHHVYVVDQRNHRIHAYAADTGEPIARLSLTLPASATLETAAVDSVTGDLYVVAAGRGATRVDRIAEGRVLARIAVPAAARRSRQIVAHGGTVDMRVVRTRTVGRRVVEVDTWRRLIDHGTPVTTPPAVPYDPDVLPPPRVGGTVDWGADGRVRYAFGARAFWGWQVQRAGPGVAWSWVTINGPRHAGTWLVRLTPTGAVAIRTATWFDPATPQPLAAIAGDVYALRLGLHGGRVVRMAPTERS